jgi:hypothetical protein
MPRPFDTDIVSTGKVLISTAGSANTPVFTLRGGFFSGGTASTTKPLFLIEPSGTTSSSWNTSGTCFGINAPSSHGSGDLIWLGLNGARRFSVGSNGAAVLSAGLSVPQVGDPSNSWNIISSSFRVTNGGHFGWYSNVQNAATLSAAICRDSNNLVSIRCDRSSQGLRVCNDWSSLVDYECIKIGWERVTADAIVVGSASNSNTLNVSSVTSGALAVGQTITGAGIANGTRLLSGSGSTWTMSISQTFTNATITGGAPVARIGTEKGSLSGVARSLELQVDAIPVARWEPDGTFRRRQESPVSVDASATLTTANLRTGIIVSSPIAAISLTLPSGASVEGAFPVSYIDLALDWTVINTGSNTLLVLAATDHAITGSGAVAQGTSARFTTRKTGTNTFQTYRIS